MTDVRADSDRVELKIAGRVYSGWKAISIELDLDAGAAAFELGITERWPGQPDRWAIEAGSACVVTIGRETAISGYVDKLSSKLEGESHEVSVSGRSRAGDLIDCSAVHATGSWSNRRLEQIAIELAEPFGIAVQVRADTGAPFRKFALQQGETVWDAIQRMCAHRALLAVSTPEGDVEIIAPRPIGAPARLAQGVHPLSIGGEHDVSERHSQYIVKGQRAGDDETNGRAAASVRGEARDPAVRRYRPLILVAEDQADAGTARQRAEFEATSRAAKAQKATIHVPQWRRADGLLWLPQQAVDLEAPAAWMAGTMMVAGVKLIVDASGKRAELRLVLPEAYAQRRVPEEAEASRVRRGRGREQQRRERRSGAPDAARPAEGSR